MQKKLEVPSVTGTSLYVLEWKEQEEPKAVVQLVHGMEEHIGRYDSFARFLAKKGYVVVGHDHLGHGNTAKQEEEFGYFAKENGWNILAQDIHQVQNSVQSLYPNIPYFILGHSMGSLLVRTYLTQYTDNLKGAILMGTSGQQYGLSIAKVLARLTILLKGEKYRSNMLESLVTGSFNNRFAPNRTKADWLTREENKVDEYLEDALCGIPFTAKGFLDLFQGSSYLAKQQNVDKTLKIPLLVVSGDEDPVGANSKGVIRVYKMLQKTGNENVSIRLFKQARHELLNEINRQEIYYFLLDWLEKQEK